METSKEGNTRTLQSPALSETDSEEKERQLTELNEEKVFFFLNLKKSHSFYLK